MRNDLLPFGQPCLSKEEIKAVLDVLESGWIGMGKKCIEFEEDFARYSGAKDAISVSSCTAALHLSLLISDVSPGDEVITTPMTFAATTNAIHQCGAEPVFVDIDPITLNIDVEQIEEKITSKTKAIIPVHFGGLPCDMDEINALAAKHDLKVVEDAAHAVGAKYQDKMIGDSNNPVCFSFYPNKNITTIEGGMLTVAESAAAEKARLLRLQGLGADAWKRFQTKSLMLTYLNFPGFKYNMTDIQATLGITQLKKIEDFLEKRQWIAGRYDEAFSELEGLSPYIWEYPDKRHGLHLYLIRLDLEKLAIDRNTFIHELRNRNIGATVHYESLHMHPYYKEHHEYEADAFPHAHQASLRNISLPLSPRMSEQDTNDVIEAVKEVHSNFLEIRAYSLS